MNVFKRVILLTAVVCAPAFSATAQSMAEISAAKSMAKAYGYTDKEIDDVLNHNISGGGVTQVVTATATPTTVATPAARTEVAAEETTTATVLTPAEPAAATPTGIYGHSYFTSKGLSVIPSYNAPAPASYVLGPGDEIVIDIWGAATSHIVAEIGNDGAIAVFDIGPVYLSGMTLNDAENALRAQLTRMYSGLDNGNGGDTFLRLSIGKIKGVSVSVMGEVVTPGLYTIPSLTSITSAIYLAGGVTDHGTVRNINVFRGGQKISSFDLYALIFDGKIDGNIRLQENDVISVEPYGDIVTIQGSVVRGMRYEMKEGETVQDAVRYAGGFTTAAQKDQVNLTRRNEDKGEAFDINESVFKKFTLKDGDIISVRSIPDMYTNRVTISGPVAHPGSYAISDKTEDVAGLIKAAGGLIEGAYVSRGQINRLDEKRLPVFLTFDLEKVLSGQEKVNLVRDDRVTLFTQRELTEVYNVSVSGFVHAPGTFTFSEGMTLADALLLAKGVREDTYLSRGQISRTDSQGVPQIIPFNVENAINGTQNIKLMRSDNIRIYSIRELKQDATIQSAGEVKSPSTFTYREGITIEDIVMMSGGFTNGVDLRNVEISSRGGREMGHVETYDLEANPQLMSMMLKPYDIVSFRRLTYFRPQTTVTVTGEVISPGTYVADKAEVKLSDVLAKVGGFTEKAYIHGATLSRTLTTEERQMLQTAALIANQSLGKDTIKFSNISDSFFIAIELDKALASPGSQYDIILRAGDQIHIPEHNNTVRVTGAVLYPNILTYEKGASWKDYVAKAGGFTQKARKNKSYAVYMNNNVSTAKQGMAIEPGAEIVIPEKNENTHKMSIGELAAITSSCTSLATLATALIGIFK